METSQAQFTDVVDKQRQIIQNKMSILKQCQIFGRDVVKLVILFLSKGIVLFVNIKTVVIKC
jgi:hypothetical protein